MNQISHPIVNGPSHTYYVGHILCAIFLQCKYYSFSRTDNLVSFCWIIETFANNFTLLFFLQINFVLCVVIRHWNSNSFEYFFVFDRLKSIRGLLSIKSNVLQDSHNPASSKSFWLGQSFFVFVVSSSKKLCQFSAENAIVRLPADYPDILQSQKTSIFYIFFRENLESHSQPKVLSTGQPSCSVKIFCYDFDTENDFECTYWHNLAIYLKFVLWCYIFLLFWLTQ